MPEPKSRRLPKPIWFAVVAVLIVVLPVWLPYLREQVAIREIERTGGNVELVWDPPEWIWGSWFDRVDRVAFSSFSHPSSKPKVFGGLDGLGGLHGHFIESSLMLPLGSTTKDFYSSISKFTDSGLKYLKGLTKLSTLDLNNTEITDKGLKHLSGLTHLSWLSLGNLQGAIVNCCVLWNSLSGRFLHDSVLEGTPFDDECDLFVAA